MKPKLVIAIFTIGIFLIILFVLFFNQLSLQWQRNSSSLVLSHLLFSSDEIATMTPALTTAIGTVCKRRELPCNNLAFINLEEQNVELVDLFNTIFFSQEKSPLYFFNKPYTFSPSDLYIDGNGSFEVSESSATLFGTNYIEFRLYIPYHKKHNQIDISLTVANSKPPPIQFDILVQDIKVETISFDLGNGIDTTKSVQIDLPPGYYHVKILYANDLFDVEKGIDRNAYIRKLTLAPQGNGF